MSGLVISDLSVDFGGVRALDGISAELSDRAIGLIGPNGAGKTTLVNCLTGVVAPSSGSARFGEVQLTGVPLHRLAHVGVIRSFQHAKLFPDLTAAENVMIGAHRRGRAGFFSAAIRGPAIRSDEQTLRAHADEALAAISCDHLADVPARYLTIGQQRLISVARALAAKPGFLILDEPAAGLSDTEAEQLSVDLRRVVATGTTLLMIEHRLPIVMDLCGVVMVLADGQLVAVGSPEQVRHAPQVISAYLGASA